MLINDRILLDKFCSNFQLMILGWIICGYPCKILLFVNLLVRKDIDVKNMRDSPTLQLDTYYSKGTSLLLLFYISQSQYGSQQ